MEPREESTCTRCGVGTEFYATLFANNNTTRIDLCSECCCDLVEKGWELDHIKESFIREFLKN